MRWIRSNRPHPPLIVSKPIAVVLVDDHPLVREGLRAVLQTVPDVKVVAEAATPDDAAAAVRAHLPDVVLLDLVLQGADGIEVLRRIRAGHPAVQVVVLTSFGEEDRVRAAIEAGALGFLLKDVQKDDLVRAIRQAAAGRPALHPEVQRHLMRRTRSEDAAVPLATLTPRERTILTLIARGRNNRTIADELGLTRGTVKVNVSRILSKLGVQDRTQAALVALRAGLVPLTGEPRE
jgi:two-component system, NarL family, response regulator LiaR